MNSTKKMYGYGLGYVGQGSAYNFMTAYFVLFLTNCIGLDGKVAGLISSLALFVEVVIGMIVGNLSDNCTSKMGRRRPFMLTAAFTVPPILYMVTTKIEAAFSVTVAYYLVFAVLFRVFFSFFEIPTNAFGAEIAPDYDERTKLRTITRVFSIIGNAIGYITPLLIFDLYKDDNARGWQVTGMIMAATACVFWLLCVYLTRNKSIILSKAQVVKKKNILKSILKNYYDLYKLKAMKILIVYKATFACAFALYNVGMLYYMQYGLGLGNRYASYMYAYQIAIFVVMTPIIDKMAHAIGKANQQYYSMLAGGCVGLIIFFTMPNNVIGGIIYIGLFSVVQTGFWQVSSSIFYDVVEVDEYVNNKRREGDIMSLVSVLGTCTTAVMVQCFGFLLDASGFKATLETQPEGVTLLVNCTYILVPALCFLIGAFALKRFPINKKSFAALQKVLELRRAGQDYTIYLDDIEKVIE